MRSRKASRRPPNALMKNWILSIRCGPPKACEARSKPGWRKDPEQAAFSRIAAKNWRPSNPVARLVGLENTMTRLAGGDLSAEINVKRSSDEIGQMADALSVFREGIARANAVAAEQASEQQAKQQHAAAIDTLTRNFNDDA